jgi:hypothetical protein
MCTSSEQKMEQFVQTFASLRNAPGMLPWDALALDQWASGSAISHGTLCAARFVLSVWDPGTKWRCGRFDLTEALRCWDPAHHVAFLRWVAAPWWP